MYLGIEIGGTKLQLGVGDGTSAQLAAWERLDIDAKRGAAGILEQIEKRGGWLDSAISRWLDWGSASAGRSIRRQGG